MSGASHGGKGDARRTETTAGAYASGFGAIDWTASRKPAEQDEGAAAALDSVSMEPPAVPA